MISIRFATIVYTNLSVCLPVSLSIWIERKEMELLDENTTCAKKLQPWNGSCHETILAMKRFLKWNDSCHETVLIMKRFLSQSNHHILWGSDSPSCNSTWSDSIGSRCTEGIFPEYVPYCTLVVQYLHSWLILIYFLK